MSKKDTLRDSILITCEGLEDLFSDCPPRYLGEKNMTSLKDQLKVEKVDLSINDAYRPEANLEDSKVLGSLLLK